MRPKRTIWSAVLATVAGAIFASGANAAMLNLGFGSHRSGNGGEFAVRPSTTGNTTVDNASKAWVSSVLTNYSPLATVGSGDTRGFETFCIEYNEHFSPGSNYNYQISGGAIKGGMTVTDIISVGSGFLYGLFAKGQLPDYGGYASNTRAGQLQQTLWFLEGEQATSGGIWDALLIAEFGSLANARLDFANSATYGLNANASTFGVAAINMGAAPTYPNQDQLIYLGGGFQQVPDGGTTLMLIGLAMSGIVVLRRKLK